MAETMADREFHPAGETMDPRRAPLRRAIARTVRPRLPVLAALALTGCQEYDVQDEPQPACPETAEIPAAVVDPWNLVIEWEWFGDQSETGSSVLPAVGNLTDDDGDGKITARDDPDVVFVTTPTTAGRLVALNGRDGSEIFTRDGFRGDGGVAIADVDGDGWPEIVAQAADGRARAVDRRGDDRWVSEVLYLTHTAPTVADLDEDGVAEVVFDDHALDGVTGGTVATLQLGDFGPTPGLTSVVADLDRDGAREIVFGGMVSRPDGTTKWIGQVPTSWIHSAVADLDGDPDGEVVFAGGGRSTLLVSDADGAALREIHHRGIDNVGPPCVADFDGDGEVEIATSDGSSISVFNRAGTLVWSVFPDDLMPAPWGRCSAFDGDGDGAFDLFYVDLSGFWIFDGSTGAVRFHDGDHVVENPAYPVIADVDNDRSAEIIVVSVGNLGSRAVTVYGHAESGWAPSGPTWAIHDFTPTRLNADGSVPRHEDSPWEVFNGFRARPSTDPCVEEDAR